MQYISDAIVHFLATARSLADCRSGLIGGLGKVFAGDALEGLEAAAGADLHAFMLMVAPAQFTSRSADRQLGDVLKIMPEAAPDHNAEVTRPYFLPLLRSYPQFGEIFVKQSEEAAAIHGADAKFILALETYTQAQEVAEKSESDKVEEARDILMLDVQRLRRYKEEKPGIAQACIDTCYSHVLDAADEVLSEWIRDMSELSTVLANQSELLATKKFKERMADWEKARALLCSHATWQHETVECGTKACEIRKALECMGAVLQCVPTLEDLLADGNSITIAPEKLTEAMDLQELDALRALVDRAEAHGRLDVMEAFSKMKQFFKSTVYPKICASLDLQASGPVKNLEKCWTTMVGLSRALAKSLVTRGSEDATAAEATAALTEALHDVASISVDEDLESLTKIACSTLQQQRCQVLRRVFSIGDMLAKSLVTLQMDPVPADQSLVVLHALATLQKELETLSAWVKGNKGSFSDIDKDWFAQAAECERFEVMLGEILGSGKAQRRCRNQPHCCGT